MVLRLFLVVLLTVAVLGEGYYLYIMAERVQAQEEELRSISQNLQILKNERANLTEELSSIKKSGGERKDGNTGQRQY